MGPLPQPEPTDITIKPITSEEDLPICAYLADVALKPDGLHEFKARYGTANVYTETLARLTESLHDQQRFRLFKAVVPSHLAQHESPSVGADPSETIVGFAQYRYGYIETSKVDPFKPQQETPDSLSPRITATNVTVPETDKQPSVNDSSDKDDLIVPEGALTTQIPKPFYSDPDAELGRKLGNAYIGTIRGKRHICKSQLLVSASSLRWLHIIDHDIPIHRPPPIAGSSILPAQGHWPETPRLGGGNC